MKYIWLLFLLYFLILPCFSISQIACPLVWSDYHLGDIFPKNAIQNNLQSISNFSKLNASTTEIFFARIKRLAKYEIGTIENQFNVSFDKKDIDTTSVLQVLTNPFNCSLKWVSIDAKRISTKLLVSLGTWKTYTKAFVGGEKSEENNNKTTVWTPCRLRISHFISCFSSSTAHQRQATRAGKTLFALQSSIQPKLRAELYNLATSNKTLGPPETLKIGCDKIRNKGEVDVTRLVTHSKETSKKETTNNFEVGISGNVDGQVEFELALVVAGAKVFFGGISIHLSLDLSGNFGYDKSTDSKTTVSSTQRINVPPKTMVEACSQLVSRSLNYTFEGKARITHPFLSREEIIELLKTDPRFVRPFELSKDATSVIAGVKGIVREILPFESEFTLVPINKLM